MDGQPKYRIQHFNEECERVAFENELSAGSLKMPINDDPRAPYKVFEGDELKGTYATRAEGGNSNSKVKPETQSLHVIS